MYSRAGSKPMEKANNNPTSRSNAAQSKPNEPQKRTPSQNGYNYRQTTTVKMGFGVKEDSSKLPPAYAQQSSYSKKSEEPEKRQSEWGDQEEGADQQLMIEILRKQVATMQTKMDQKDMQILNFRADVARMTKNNTNLRAKVMSLKEQLIDKEGELV